MEINSVKVCNALVFKGCIAEIPVEAITARKVYQILNTCFFEDVALPDFEKWYPDFSHRVWHNMSRACGLQDRSVAITTFETNDRAILGGVATLPEFRGKKMASTVVLALCSALKKEGKQIFTLANDDMLGFYKNLGFEFYDKYGFVENMEDVL